MSADLWLRRRLYDLLALALLGGVGWGVGLLFGLVAGGLAR